MSAIEDHESGFVHECYYGCNSGEHPSNLNAAITKASLSDEKVAAYLKWYCVQYAGARDSNGRNLIHVAASMGRLKLLIFLLNHGKVNIDVKDGESNYSALHRSLFYGQIHCAVRLIQMGANFYQKDFDDLTPLDHVMKDRSSILTYDNRQPCEVYVWGMNTSYNLGIGHNNSRSNPEPLSFFRQKNILVKKAFMSEFHSLFIGQDGKVWVCGLGWGGRLGLGEKETILVPSILKIKNNYWYSCKAASIGINHTLLLLENSSVWSYGLNTYHQLGHYPPPENVLSPKQIKSLNRVNIIGISASKFHSVFWTKNQVYTCGLNGGQLGHAKANDNTISVPTLVTAIELKASTIQDVASSDGAIAVVSSKGDVYLFRDYQCKRLKIGKGPTKKICLLGGHLDQKVLSGSLRETGVDDLMILILTRKNSIYLWREMNEEVSHCLISLNRWINITDVILNKASLMLTTSDGEAFLGEIKPKMRRTSGKSDNSDSSPKVSRGGSNHIFPEVDDCDYIKMKRIPYVHRAVSVSSDLKGRNFAVVQVHPKAGLLKIPSVEATSMRENMRTLLERAGESDRLHDVVFKVGGIEFPAHRYVVSHSSDVMEEMIAKANVVEGVRFVNVENVRPRVFENVLHYLYTGECDLLKSGIRPLTSIDLASDATVETADETVDPAGISAYEYYKRQRSRERRNSSRFKVSGSKDTVERLRDAAQSLGVYALTKALESVLSDSGRASKAKENWPPIKFNRMNLRHLWDVSLKSQDGEIVEAHKCILVARLEYFSCMITQGWLESSSKTPLSLSIPSAALKILIRYLYTDDVPELIDSNDTDLSTYVLKMADQFLCPRLKEIAEVSLSNAITLKIAAEMLQLAVAYNAEQLKQCSMEFICLNLSALLETRSLEILDDSLLTELKDFYRSWLPCVNKRNVSTHSAGPCDALVESIYISRPVSLDVIEEESPKPKPKTGKEKAKEKKKRMGEPEGSGNASDDGRSDVNSIRRRTSNNSLIEVTNHDSPKHDSSKTSPGIKSNDAQVTSGLDPKPPSEVENRITKSAPNNGVRIRSPLQRSSLSDSEKDFRYLDASSEKEFPALGASPPERNAILSPKSPRCLVFKKFTKLSKKQRKKLSINSLGENESEGIGNREEEARKRAWIIPNKFETDSMAEIMKKESEASKSGSATSSTPWQASSSSTSPSLSAIMADERHQRDLVIRMKTKSFEHTQMEDKAIGDLILLYDVQNVTDERITVRRADVSPFEFPVAGEFDGVESGPRVHPWAFPSPTWAPSKNRTNRFSWSAASSAIKEKKT